MPPYSSFPGASCQEPVSGANRTHGGCASAHWSLQACLCGKCAKQRASAFDFFSQCKMNHRLVGLQERGDHWRTESSAVAPLPGLGLNTLILPGPSPSFCHWLCYRPINFLMSFPGSALIPRCCQREQPPCKDLYSRNKDLIYEPFFSSRGAKSGLFPSWQCHA